jgi:hypothetical protein
MDITEPLKLQQTVTLQINPIIKRRRLSKTCLDNELTIFSTISKSGDLCSLYVSPKSRDKKTGVYVINPCSPRGTPNEKHAYAGLAGHQDTFKRNQQEFCEATRSNRGQGVHNLISAFQRVRARRLFDNGTPDGTRPDRGPLHEVEQATFRRLVDNGVILWNQKLDSEIKSLNEKNIEALLKEFEPAPAS